MFTGEFASVQVLDVFSDAVLGVTNASTFTVPGIPWQGTALLRLSAAPQRQSSR